MDYRKFIPYLIIALFGMIAYWQVAFGVYLLKWDNVDGFLPYRRFVSECLHSGIWPKWNPYINFGYPVLSDPQGGAWYPIVWILSLFGIYGAGTLHVEWTFHLILAGWGMYYLGRQMGVDKKVSVLMGIAYLGSGFFTGTAQIMLFLIGAAWLPWIIGAWLKFKRSKDVRSAIWLAVLLYMALSGSYPAFTILLAYLLIFLFIREIVREIKAGVSFKSWLKPLGVGAVLLGVMSAPYLYYLFEAMPLVGRGSALELRDVFFEDSFGFRSWLTFLTPYVAAGDFEWFGTDISMVNGYAGFFVLIAAIFGSFQSRYKRFNLLVWGIIVLCLLLGLSEELPVRRWFHEYVPGFALFRHPGIFRLYIIFGLILLFGRNFDWVMRSGWRVGGMIAALIAIPITIMLFTGDPEFHWARQIGMKFPLLEEKSEVDQVHRIALQACLLLIFGVALLVTRYLKPTYTFGAFVILMCLDHFQAVQLNSRATLNYHLTLAETRAGIASLPQRYDIPLDKPLVQNLNDSTNIGIAAIWRNESMWLHRISPDGYNPFQLKSFNALEQSPEWRTVIERPFVYSDSPIEKELLFFEPGHMKFRIRSASPADVVVAQNTYPRWELRINGEQRPFKEGVLLEFEVPGGESEVEVVFR